MDMSSPPGSDRQIARSNPDPGALYFIQTLPPHSETLVSGIVCPQNKRLKILGCFVSLERIVASSADGYANCSVVFKPSGVGKAYILRTDIFTLTKGTKSQESIYSGLIINPLDQLQLYTWDLSASGQIRYLIGAHYQIFDIQPDKI